MTGKKRRQKGSEKRGELAPSYLWDRRVRYSG